MKKKIIASVAAVAVIGGLGLSQLQEHEGRVNQTYIDPVGIPTVCYGHTGRFAKRGAAYTNSECQTILTEDLQSHDKAMHKCIRVPLTRGQHDALLSFTFNVGPTKACRSTMFRKLNAGDYSGASREFNKWTYGNVRGRMVRLPGLVRRRADETRMFNSGGELVAH